MDIMDFFEYDIDFILGYLKESIKLKHEPQKLLEIILFLTKEIKKIKEEKHGSIT